MQQEAQKEREKAARQKALENIRKAKKIQTQRLAHKLKTQKLSRWARDKKQKQIDHVAQLKENVVQRKLRKTAGRPMRAKNAYMWYYTKNFKSIAKELGSGKINIGQVAKLTKEKFGKLPEAEKKEYQVLAEQDKARYTTENKKFIAHKKSGIVLTPYIRFANDVRNTVTRENPNAKMIEVTKIIGKNVERFG